MKKRIFSVLISLLLVLCLSLTGCDMLSELLPDDGGSEVTAIVKLEFSPTLLLALNDSGDVLGACGLNDDAVILLYEPNETESTLIGSPVTTAVKKLINTASKFGFINSSFSAVGVSVLSKESGKALTIEATVSTAIEQACNLAGVSSNVSTELSYAAKKAYLAFDDLHSSDMYSEVDEKSFDFAYALSKYNSTSVEDEVEFHEQDMVEKLANLCLSYKNYETASFRLAKKNADIALEQAISTELDRLWLARYRDEKNAVKGAAFELFYFDYLYATAEIKSIKQMVNYLDVLEYLVFDSEKTAEILEAFKLSENDAKLVANRNGNVTVDSVEQYANMMEKNGKAFDKDRIDAIISSFNNNVYSLKDRFVDEKKKDIESEINSIFELADSVKLAESDAVIYASIVYLKESYDELVSDGSLSYFEIEVLVASLDGVADSIVNTAKSALEGLEADMQIATNNKLAELERPDSAPMLSHNSKIKKAKNDARSWLLEARSALRSDAME